MNIQTHNNAGCAEEDTRAVLKFGSSLSIIILIERMNKLLHFQQQLSLVNLSLVGVCYVCQLKSPTVHKSCRNVVKSEDAAGAYGFTWLSLRVAVKRA